MVVRGRRRAPAAPVEAAAAPVADGRPKAAHVAVCCVCHRPYLGYLRALVESIERQEPQPAEKVVAFDGCDAPRWLRALPGWRVVRGDWGHPSGGRNAGLAATSAPWVTWWDADNVMPPGYVAHAEDRVRGASPSVGIYYPDLAVHDEALAALKNTLEMPEPDYWDLRRSNYVDSSAVWRRQAVEEAGGWRFDAANEDWGLALAVTRQRWTTERLMGPAVIYREHPGQRHVVHPSTSKAWPWRSLGVLTLFAGRQRLLPMWLRWVKDAELPPMTTFYAVDNGLGPAGRRVLEDAFPATGERRLRFIDLSGVTRADSSNEGKHRHVAELYRMVLPQVEEDLLLLLEDDVEAPFDAVRVLVENLRCGSAVGAAGAVYPCREHLGYCVGAMGEDWWHDSPKMSDLPTGPLRVGMIGGGCTLYHNGAVRRSMPIRCTKDAAGRLLGWDGNLCQGIRSQGLTVMLDGRVRCRHLF